MRGGSNIQPGDYALIVTSDNEIEFLMPDLDEIENKCPVPKLAIALIAVANYMSDELWVNETIQGFFEETDCGSDKSKIK